MMVNLNNMQDARADLSWDYYRSFLAVMRSGSLLSAAKTLELAQPTIGRHINGLEKALGAALFIRSGAGLAPTPLAFEVRSHAESMEIADLKSPIGDP